MQFFRKPHAHTYKWMFNWRAWQARNWPIVMKLTASNFLNSRTNGCEPWPRHLLNLVGLRYVVNRLTLHAFTHNLYHGFFFPPFIPPNKKLPLLLLFAVTTAAPGARSSGGSSCGPNCTSSSSSSSQPPAARALARSACHACSARKSKFDGARLREVGVQKVQGCLGERV